MARFQIHPEIRPRFDFRQPEFASGGQYGGLSRIEAGFGVGQCLDFGKMAEPFGVIKQDLEWNALVRPVIRLSRLLDGGDDPETQVLEQAPEVIERLRPVGKSDLDLFARLRGPGSARPFVGDPIFALDAPQPERFVRRGEIARGVVVIRVLLDGGRLTHQSAVSEGPPEPGRIGNPELDFDFITHASRV